MFWNYFAARCNVLDLQNRKLNSMKTMSTRVGEQGKFHYNPIDRRGILLLCRREGEGKPMQRK